MQASEQEAFYQSLIEFLSVAGYTFVCPSPETQARVVRRRHSDGATRYAKTIVDFFGWSLSCSRDVLDKLLPNGMIEKLESAGAIASNGGEDCWSTIRVSNFYPPNIPAVDDQASPLYYVHSSFPASSDSVFFGPDTYLFISYMQSIASLLPKDPKSAVDVCCGSGAGAIHLARTYSNAKILGLDLNATALRLGGVNARLADCNVLYRKSDLYSAIPVETKDEGIDIIVSNPPYIATSVSGTDLPIYADGGANFGLDLSIRIAKEGLKLLTPGGVIVLYTGVAIPVSDPGQDPLLSALMDLKGLDVVQYTVLHPDMWSEEIGHGAYAEVGRIQSIGTLLKKRVT